MPNSVDLLSGAINRILTRAGGWGVPYLFNNDEVGVWYDPSDRKTMFQNSDGTTLVSVGDPVGYIADKSGNGLNAVQATAPARPILVQSDDGDYILQNDEVDDALTVTFPDMGTDCTVAFVTQSEVRLDEGVTLNGSYTLPQIDILGFVAIDRALNVGEQINLILYLTSKATGVSYGASIDRLDLIAVNAVDVFVYDTSKDSDGGAWATSYPNQMVIVAEAASVKIYDATSASLTLHTTLDFTGYTVKALSAVSGVLSVGTTTGLATLNLADGDTTVALDYTTSTTPAIVNNTVNDVAMTVLPDAPIDPATGLPVPTIAVATDGNGIYSTSVITDGGTVYDIASDSTGSAVSVAFDGVSLSVVRSDGTVYVWDDVGAITTDGASPDATYSASSTPALLGTVSKVAA